MQVLVGSSMPRGGQLWPHWPNTGQASACKCTHTHPHLHVSLQTESLCCQIFLYCFWLIRKVKKKKNANAFSIILTETCEKYICMMQHSGYVLTLCRRIFVYTSGFHTCTCIIITGGACKNTGLWTLFPELLIQYL